MKNEPRNHGEFDELDAAVNAIRSQTTTDPSEDLLDSTVETLQANDTSIDHSVTVNDPFSRREMMFRFAKFGTAGIAATLAVILLGSTLLSGVTGQAAFAEVLESLRNAKGARYSLVQKFGELPVMNCQGAFSGKFVRTEVPKQFVYLANVESRKFLQLVPNQKMAVRGKFDDGTQQPVNIRELMSDLTEDQTKLVETIEENGKVIDVYRIDQLPKFMGMGKLSEKDSFKIWVDRHTQLPTKVRIRTTMGVDAMPIAMDFSKFEWDPAFPANFFEMKVPDGYKTQTISPTLGEQELEKGATR